MAEQNHYQISYESPPTEDQCFTVGVRPGDTWQQAIHNWLAEDWYKDAGISYQGHGISSYEVVSETPSEDGKSGVMAIWEELWLVAKIKATLIPESTD